MKKMTQAHASRILNIPLHSDYETVYTAYTKMAVKNHPDFNNKNKRDASEKFYEINMAYATLVGGNPVMPIVDDKNTLNALAETIVALQYNPQVMNRAMPYILRAVRGLHGKYNGKRGSAVNLLQYYAKGARNMYNATRISITVASLAMFIWAYILLSHESLPGNMEIALTGTALFGTKIAYDSVKKMEKSRDNLIKLAQSVTTNFR